MPELRLPIPAQIVGQAHAAGRIALHGVNAAVGGAGAAGDDGPGPRSEPIDPLANGDRLAGLGVGSETGPVTLGLVGFVGDRAFDHQDERPEFSGGGLVIGLEEVVAGVIGQDGVMERDVGQTGNCPANNVFDAGLRGSRDGDRVAVASQPAVIHRMSTAGTAGWCSIFCP